MRAGAAIASSARHAVGVALQALLIASIVAALGFAAATVAGSAPGGAKSVFAAKGDNGGGRLTATISLAEGGVAALAIDGSTTVSFAVTRSIADDTVMWVTNDCFDATGQLLTSTDLPVAWGMWYSLDGVAGPFEAAGSTCTAYVTLRPWQDRPLGDAILTYPVQ